MREHNTPIHNTLHEFAVKLNHREYREELSREEIRMAKELGFVIVFGASDDLIEFYGAINEEFDCYGGGFFQFDALSKCFSPVEENEVNKNCFYIEPLFAEGEYTWVYRTNIPHAEFDIIENGEKYCRGIIFSLDSLLVDSIGSFFSGLKQAYGLTEEELCDKAAAFLEQNGYSVVKKMSD